MTAKKILYLFDVDGTLTAPRQAISSELRDFLLDEVRPAAAVGLVSGSDYRKITEQIGGEHVAARFQYLFCENGLVYYRHGELRSSQSILGALGEARLQRLINFSLGYLAGIELPAKRGNFVEFRTGMINLSPVGRSCSQTEREQFAEYDLRHRVRETMVQALQQEFRDSGLTFALGGQISIDVFPTGWDKTYCLNHVQDAHYDEIHFFGDRTEPGGNDYELFSDTRTIGHTVISPEDTHHQLRECLTLL